MNGEDATVPAAVARRLPEIAAAIDATAARMARGGRLIYAGAGTAGRLGVLDASECPPTFNTDPSEVLGLIAGGPSAMVTAVEGAEDSKKFAVEDLTAHRPDRPGHRRRHLRLRPHAVRDRRRRARPRPGRADHRPVLQRRLRAGRGRRARHRDRGRPRAADRLHPAQGGHRPEAGPQHALDHHHDPAGQDLRESDGRRPRLQRKAAGPLAPHRRARHRRHRPGDRDGAPHHGRRGEERHPHPPRRSRRPHRRPPPRQPPTAISAKPSRPPRPSSLPRRPR